MNALNGESTVIGHTPPVENARERGFLAADSAYHGDFATASLQARRNQKSLAALRKIRAIPIQILHRRRKVTWKATKETLKALFLNHRPGISPSYLEHSVQ